MTDMTTDTLPAGQGDDTALHGGTEEKKLGFWLTLPAQLLVLFIALFPILMQVYISLTDWSPLDGIPWYRAYELWIGLLNYADLAADPRFWSALWRTCIVMAICVPVQFFLGLGLAILFVDDFRGKRVLYSTILVPMMVVPAVAGYMFFMLFQSGGPVNDILSFFAGRPVTIAWLSDPDLALFATIVSDIWQWTPLMFLILLAGMVSVPQDQQMAAVLLGGLLDPAVLHHRAAADEDDHHHRHRDPSDRELQGLRQLLHHDRGRAGRRDRNHLHLHLQGHPAGADLGLCRSHRTGHPDRPLHRIGAGHQENEERTMTEIVMQNLGKEFGDFTALADMDLTIGSGEFVALLGPSGCGKSTTMNMIAGMLDPTHGDILFDGRNMNGVPMAKRGVGFVFQNYAIFTHMTVRDNLAYGLKS